MKKPLKSLRNTSGLKALLLNKEKLMRLINTPNVIGYPFLKNVQPHILSL